MGRGGWWDLTGSSCSIQGFWYFARSRSREIQVNRRNPAIFTKTRKILQNSVEILSNTCLYHIFETYFSYRSYLLVVNLQIYLGTSSLKRANNLPKPPGVDYVAKNCALAMMLKALPLVHFWTALLLKEQKRSKCWSDQRKFRVKFALKITTKSAVFYRLLFSEVCPENSREIGWFFRKFLFKNPAKFDFSFRDLSEALSIWRPPSSWEIFWVAHPLYPKLIEMRKVSTAKGHPLLSIMPHVKPSGYNLRKETCFKPKINTSILKTLLLTVSFLNMNWLCNILDFHSYFLPF